MSKYIDKVEQYKNKTLLTALDKLQSEYRDAEDWFNDTGYDRYYKKMSKCENEIKEIEEYLEKDTQQIKEVSTEQYKDYLRLKQLMTSVNSNITYIIEGLPECTEKMRLMECIREIKDYIGN